MDDMDDFHELSLSRYCECTPPTSSTDVSDEIGDMSPVCDPNADLTLQSSDGVLFKVFSKDLEAYSGAFPSAEIIKTSQNETVLLPETSAVLELLLQYMRRQRQPDIRKLEFALLYALAEAAEKYEVYSATEVCKAYMMCAPFSYSYKSIQPTSDSTSMSRHPMEVLGYATRHDYDDIRDMAAPLTLDSSFSNAQAFLSTDALLAWVQFSTIFSDPP
jgi:hypothetical protein